MQQHINDPILQSMSSFLAWLLEFSCMGNSLKKQLNFLITAEEHATKWVFVSSTVTKPATMSSRIHGKTFDEVSFIALLLVTLFLKESSFLFAYVIPSKSQAQKHHRKW
jgi:hypothetical protein